ncbi:MAG: AzlD domain-containing protein [Acidimicrobiia bacterium]|nr:AzlD domain-containing protein [Acidimicrobiia bacterium]
MSTTAALAAVLVVGLLTYSARAVPILFLADRALPAPLERALRYVGPAVLSALVITLVAGGDGRTGVDGAEWIALAVAVVVAAATRNLIITLVVGMAALWIADGLL